MKLSFFGENKKFRRKNMKNNRWKKALSVALVCCMLAGTGLTSENWGVEFDATLKEEECLYRTRYSLQSKK